MRANAKIAALQERLCSSSPAALLAMAKAAHARAEQSDDPDEERWVGEIAFAIEQLGAPDRMIMGAFMAHQHARERLVCALAALRRAGTKITSRVA